LVFAQANLDCDSPIFKFPTIARMTGAHHHAQLFDIEIGSHKLSHNPG
jgi:hypothetical protein